MPVRSAGNFKNANFVPCDVTRRLKNKAFFTFKLSNFFRYTHKYNFIYALPKKARIYVRQYLRMSWLSSALYADSVHWTGTASESKCEK